MQPNLSNQFATLWESSSSPPDVFAFLEKHAGCETSEKLAVLLLDQQRRWKTTQPLRVESYLGKIPDLASDLEIKLQLAVGEYQARQQGDSSPSHDEFLTRFPDLGDTLRNKLSALGSAADEERRPDGVTKTQSFVSTVAQQRIGRYRLLRVLGEGAFGRVYLGFDDQLQRQVAIKVPTPERFQKPEDAEAYLAEARTVARLDHPHIVPVHDMGRTDEGSIYVVSKFIEGHTLEKQIKQDRPTPEESARLLATIADALEHAHQKRLIHRDVKPGNILLEEASGRAYLADFGLAIGEEDYLRESRIAGTPAYMSPEQARGEGHRLDGRSDIFSLGVVLYELLTGKKPFRGSTPNELLHQVVSVEPELPRELDASVPLELERICLKCLSKRASDRHRTAAELAEDLLHWRQGPEHSHQERPIVPKGLRSFDADDADFFLDLLPGPRDREGLPESIRFWKTCLEETDPDKTFSVGLLYGPSGCGKSSLVKAGLLPRLSQEVVAVYVEATPDDTETRILRGLRKQLPELPNDLGLVETFTLLRRGSGRKVVIVLDQFEQWLHAHRAERETDLVNALRQCDGGKLQAVVMVRDDFAMAASRFMGSLDIPIVQGKNFATVDLFDVDHAQKVLAKFGQAFGKLPAQLSKLSDQEREFVGAVTTSLAGDGKVVSVHLALFAEMVKGKPWVPATLQEVGGAEGIGVNFLEETFVSRSANPSHRLHQVAAREVLKALLPEVGADIKGHMRSHAELLSAAGYAERPGDFTEVLRILDGELRLITPTDPEGFQTASGSDPSSKYYQLTHDYLVPSLRDWLTRKQRETRRGRAELRLGERAATWNAKQENRFLPSLWEYLNIRTLTDARHWTDGQRRLMSRATRVHGLRSTLGVVALVVLVAIGVVVRTSVARQQEATRIEGLVGRLVSAEPNQLSQIVRELDANPEVAATFLSPLIESAGKTSDEKRSQLHARLASVARDPSLVETLVEELLTAKATYVIPIRQLLSPYSSQLTDELRSLLRDEQAEPKRRFHAALALADYIPASEANAWTDQDLKFVTQQLVSENAEFQPLLREALRPIRGKLLTDLEGIFDDAKATDAQRLGAANAFADYAASDVATLSRLLAAATPEQHNVLYPLVEASRSPVAMEDLGKVAATLPSDDLGSVARVPFGQRRANAAVTLLRLGEKEKVLPVFDWTDDPEALTQFIFRCKPRGISVGTLLDLLEMTTRSTPHQPQSARPRLSNNIRYALLLAIGEYAPAEVPSARREALVKQVADWYANDPSSGVHGASGWLLRHLGEKEIADRVDQTPVPYSPEREWFTLAITVTPTPPPKPEEKPAAESGGSESAAAKPDETGQSKGEESSQPEKPPATPVGGQGKAEPPAEPLPAKTFYYTFIVFPEGEYTIGSVADEPERSPQEDRETRHAVKLTRPFALLDREVTMEELIAYSPQYAGFMSQFKAQRTDAGFGADWYDSVGFCRWLGQQSRLSESDQPYADPESLDKEKYPREPNPGANWAPRDWPVDLSRRGFRLPTEAEWEVAARGGVRTTYGYGSETSLLGHFGWFSENSGKHVHPPKERYPSVRGLFDLHGNLFEWTHDWYDLFSTVAATDPVGPQGGSLRVGRGGSWGNGAAGCRAANRGTGDPTNRASNSGFRLALSSPSGVSSPAEQSPGKGAEPSGEGTEGAKAEPRPEMP